MQFLLRGKGLWSIVCGKEVAPPSDQSKEYKNFLQRRDVAITEIVLSIEDNCSHAVINLDDPKIVWDKLQEMYKGVSDACIDTYLVMQNLKMGADEKVMCYVNRLVELENELASVGHFLDEKEKKRTLLRGLREEFLTTVKVIRAMDMNFTKAVSELVVEEGSLEVERSSGDSLGAALATVHGRKHCCTHCGRKGHTADSCFHNPASKYYKKEIKYDFGNGNKPSNRPGSSKNKKKFKKSSDDDDDIANVALMAKSVLRGDVKVPPTMKEKWMIDSAPTSHICNNESKFESLVKQPRRPVEVCEGQHVDVHGIGIVKGTAMVDGRKQPVKMRAVLSVPTMMCNLVSVSKTRRSGFKKTFDGDENDDGFCEIVHKKTEKLYLRGIELPEGLYEAIFQPTFNSTALLSSAAQQDVWHKRLAHASTGVMAKTVPIVNGIDLQTIKDGPNMKCDECPVEKSCRQPRPSATGESRKSTRPLDLVHADVVGPMKHPSFTGKWYFIPVYEDNSALSLVRILRSKSEAGSAIKDMITDLETLRKKKWKSWS